MYGAGTDGRAGWPAAMAGQGCTFMVRLGDAVGDDPNRDSERLVQVAQDGPVHLVAVSYGGIAALLAAQQVPSRVRSLTLFEPTCPDLAPRAASVRSFRRSLEPLMRHRNDPSVTDAAFFRDFAAVTGTPTPQDLTELQTLARRLRATPPPWEIDIPRGKLLVPTLVVTGGWSDFFEDIADALVAEGAEHQVLSGHGHWVPDHPEAAQALHEFTARRER